ncbi:MAG: hypothetical protein A2V70_19720 [Planctomycetes bacterium RBG_13_63_9]|nr:MAG: hypothetical protein A2V70_19720 [Planctomycetes bacterium RBG_13_63_9]
MHKIALALAFVATGVSFIALKLGETLHIESPMLIVTIMCLPAALLGLVSWFATDSFARSRFVVLCVALAWVGLLYGAERQNYRGLLNVAYLSSTLFVGALIVESRCWWFCARILVLASTLAMGIAMWFQYQDQGFAMLYQLHRFGRLLNDEGTMKLANPNVVGGQLAFAAVLAFVLHLQSGRQANQNVAVAARPRRFSLCWTVLLSLGCILTASRGAFVAWSGGLGLLVLGGMKDQRFSKLRDLVAVSGVLFLLLMLTTVATECTPWQTLQTRLNDETSVVTASGRVMIWKSALDMWRMDPRRILLGTGTGAAPEVFGEYLLSNDTTDTLIRRTIDTHNAYVEWGLSFGLVGMAAGIGLFVVVIRKARQLDRQDGNVYRQAILLCSGLASMTYVTYYHLFLIASGGLMLSMLSQPRPVVAVVRHRGPRNKTSSSGTGPHAPTSRPGRLKTALGPVS